MAEMNIDAKKLALIEKKYFAADSNPETVNLLMNKVAAKAKEIELAKLSPEELQK